MTACFLPEEAVPFRLAHRGLSRGWVHPSQSSTGRVIEHPHKGPFVVGVEKLEEWAPHLMGTSRQRGQATLRLLTATNLCFAERNVYTSEVLAVVMQQLMEQSPLPMLLMRTVIQSLTMYPRLGGFVMNILARLIMKQVTCPGPGSQPQWDKPQGPGRQDPSLLVAVFPHHSLQLAAAIRSVCASPYPTPRHCRAHSSAESILF